MTVRLRLALTVLLTGLLTALAVIVTLAFAFQRFEHESTWQRGDAFLARVMAVHGDLLGQHRRDGNGFVFFLRNLLLYEPDNQLYLLDADGTVLASSGHTPLAPGFRVALEPVRQAVQAAARGDSERGAYVMGDDPEFMRTGAVVAARELRPALVRPEAGAAGYLYIVCHRPGLPASGLGWMRGRLVAPVLAGVAALILLTAALAAWIIATVTRPLRVLSDEVAAAARRGFAEAQAPAPDAPARRSDDDEFGRLHSGFQALLVALRQQWDALKRLDRFRRESVSNLSHDLRSPLTATVACLETLEARWAADAARGEDRPLVAMALRNTRQAAGLVRALGDLALLDEPEFQLHPMRLNLAEVLDDIALRFAARAAQRGVALRFEQRGDEAPVAEVDVELFERAVANLLDNALKFTPAGRAVVLTAERDGAWVRVRVADEGAGIAADELPRLFDRLYRGRAHAAPAGDEGKGLGLAIVQRICALHRGTVAVDSVPERGTTVTISLPAG